MAKSTDSFFFQKGLADVGFHPSSAGGHLGAADGLSHMIVIDSLLGRKAWLPMP